MLCTASSGERPCGRCAPCRKVSSGVHPDVTVISGPGEGKPITVDQVRALRSDAYIRPNEGERKIYLLEQADRMNQSAQNAMLKLLEEGPAYAVFLLLAENGGGLLQTVRSRCEELDLVPVPPAEAERWLSAHFPDQDPAAVRRAALECQGLLGRGIELLEGSGEAAETRRQQADQLVTALEGRELPRLLDQVTAVLGNRLPQSEDPRRLLRAEALVRTLRGAAELNANPGQLSGWLCAGMFIKH